MLSHKISAHDVCGVSEVPAGMTNLRYQGGEAISAKIDIRSEKRRHSPEAQDGPHKELQETPGI
jgi:hypothetical protein